MIKTFVVITDGLVSNTIEIDDVDTASITAFSAVAIPAGTAVTIGWSYDGVTLAAPIPIPLTLAQAKAKQLSVIDAAFSVENQKPISYLSFSFQADDASTELMGSVLATLTATGATGINWWDASNTARGLTYAQFAGLCAVVLTRGQVLFANKQARKELIRAAATVATTALIVW